MKPDIDTEAAEVWRGLPVEDLAAISLPWIYQAEGSSRITTPVLQSLERRGLTERTTAGQRLHFKTDLGKRVAAYGASQAEVARG